MAHLLIKIPEKPIQRFDIEDRVVTMGRTPANQVRLSDGAASRKHCMIKTVGDAFFLTDLGSANGTVVNGKRLERNREIELTGGDRIQIGNIVLVFREDD